MKRNNFSPSEMEEEAKYLSAFDAEIEEADGFDDDDLAYDGDDDDDVHFDGRADSFSSSNNSRRMLSLTLTNNNAQDVVVPVFAAFRGIAGDITEGAATEGANNTGANATVLSYLGNTANLAYDVSSNGNVKLQHLQKFAQFNPLHIIGMRLNFTTAAQASKEIRYTYFDVFDSPQVQSLNPESYRTERNQQDKIITIPERFVLGNQTELLVRIAPNERLNLFVMFGAIYNTSKSLGKKAKRAGAN